MTILTYLACEPRIKNFSALRIRYFRLFSQDAHCSLVYQHLWKWVVTKFRLILTPGHQGWSIRWIWWLRSRSCFCLKWVTVIHFNRAPPNSKTWKSNHNSTHLFWVVLWCILRRIQKTCAALYQWSILRTTDWFVLCELVRIPSLPSNLVSPPWKSKLPDWVKVCIGPRQPQIVAVLAHIHIY